MSTALSIVLLTVVYAGIRMFTGLSIVFIDCGICCFGCLLDYLWFLWTVVCAGIRMFTGLSMVLIDCGICWYTDVYWTVYSFHRLVFAAMDVY